MLSATSVRTESVIAASVITIVVLSEKSDSVVMSAESIVASAEAEAVEMRVVMSSVVVDSSPTVSSTTSVGPSVMEVISSDGPAVVSSVGESC